MAAASFLFPNEKAMMTMKHEPQSGFRPGDRVRWGAARKTGRVERAYMLGDAWWYEVRAYEDGQIIKLAEAKLSAIEVNRERV